MIVEKEEIKEEKLVVEIEESVTKEKVNPDGNANDKIVAAEQLKQSRKDSYNFTPYPAPMKLVDFSNKVCKSFLVSLKFSSYVFH
jgi:hypothetical protein